MKKLLWVLLWGGLSGCLASCSDESIPEKKNDTSTDPMEIRSVDGALHFSNLESFQATVIGLSNGEINLKDFESLYDYKSMSSLIDWAIDEITETEDLFERENALEQFVDVIEDLGEGVLLPKVRARGYTNIANTDGIYYVGDYKYSLFPDKITAEEISGTRSGNIIEGEYLMPLESKTKVTEQRELHWQQYKTSKRKVTFRLNLIRYWVVENGKIKNWYEVQTHLSGQKKGTFGWNSYKTVYNLDKFRFIVSLYSNSGPHWARLESSQYTTDIQSPEYKDWYRTWSFPQIHENSANFSGWGTLHTLAGRFRSRGTGDCGGVLPAKSVLECKASYE